MTLRPRESFSSSALSNSEWNDDDTDEESKHVILPPPLADEEVSSIQRTFNRVNRRVEGYLDCDELLAFMKLRKCPMSLWEAKIILQYADRTYHYYISSSQIVQLATLYGLGTRSPIRLNRDEFKRAMKQAFGVSLNGKVSSTSTFNHSETSVIKRGDFNGILEFFESKQFDEFVAEKPDEDNGSPSVRENNEDKEIRGRVNEAAAHDGPQIRQSGSKEYVTGAVMSMKQKWEYNIQQNNAGLPVRNDFQLDASHDYHPPSCLRNREPAEKPYESVPPPHEKSRRSRTVKSIYRRRKSFDKMLFEEMATEAKKFGLRIRNSKSRSASRDSREIEQNNNVSLNPKEQKKYLRSESNRKKASPPTPPRPIIPDLPEEWLSRKLRR